MATIPDPAKDVSYPFSRQVGKNVVIDGKMMLSPNIYTYVYLYISIYGYMQIL